MAAITKAFAFIWLAAILMIAISSTNLVAASSSMIAQFDYEPVVDPLDLTTDLGQLLRLKSKAALKPFEKVLAKFTDLNQNKCDIETQFRFAAACKEFEGKSLNDAKTVKALEGIKSLYGIRKAICETSSSGIEVPSACIVLLPNFAAHASRKTMLASDLESAVSANIPTCLKEFQRRHYYWTSYSNNLQDASAVFDVLRSDVELKNIVMAYQDFVASMYGLQDDFESMRDEISAWYLNLTHGAKSVLDLQDRAFSSFDAGFKNVSSSVFDHLRLIQSALRSNNAELEQVVFETKHGLVDLHKEASSMAVHFAQLISYATEMHKNALNDLAAFRGTQERAIVDIVEPFEHKLAALAIVANDLGTNINLVSDNVNKVSQIQIAQLSVAREQLNVADLVLLKQEQSIQLANGTYDTMQRISESAEDLGERVQAFASVVTFVDDHLDMFNVAVTYTLLSFVLRPFEAIDGSRIVVVMVKSTYCLVYLTRYLWQMLDGGSRLKNAQHLFEAIVPSVVAYASEIWLTVPLLVICLLGIFLFVTKPDHKNPGRFDLEKAMDSPRSSKFDSAYMSSSQRERLNDMPRTARHGTAPPGL